MMKNTFKRLIRTPIIALGVLLFAAILTVIICRLQKNNDTEQKKYNDTYQSIPVYFSITNLSGTTSTNLGIPQYIANVFQNEDGLLKYVSNLQKVCKHSIKGDYSDYKLIGITSTELSPELFPENGTYIEWNSDYKEDIFLENDFVCLIPNDMSTKKDDNTGYQYIELYFDAMERDKLISYNLKLRVIGTYRGGDGKSIYCPYAICEDVYIQLKEFIVVQSIRATLSNNDYLVELKNESKRWFAEPNILGEKTPYIGEDLSYEYYTFAIDIKDEFLQNAKSKLETSILINKIFTLVTFILSMIAGFLIGVLMIRNRKKEIILMRTMGLSNKKIYLSFILEQMFCYVLGIFLGGTINVWNPITQLSCLIIFYFLGISFAVLVFLQKDILISIKEGD